MDAPEPRPGRTVPLEVWVPAVYAVVSALWIAFSDDLLQALAPDPGSARRWAVLKAWAFVAATALLFHHGLRYALAARRADAARLARVERRARTLVDSSPDGILILEGLEVTFANAAAARLLGAATAEALVGLPVLQLLDPTEHALVTERAALIRDGQVFPPAPGRLMRRLDGGGVRVSVAVSRMEEGPGAPLQVSLRDASEAWRLQQEVGRITLALRMLGAVNEALVRVGSEGELMAEVCRLAVEVGRYRLAWIGFAAQEGGQAIQVAAVHGAELGAVEALGLRWGGGEEPAGPAVAALRSGRPVVVPDLAVHPSTAPRRESHAAMGLRSAMALPIAAGGSRQGVLALYGNAPDAFDAAVTPLLGQLADDLAFGLVALATRAALAEERGFLQAILESASVLVAVADGEGRLVRVNPELERLTGWSRGELLGQKAGLRLMPPDLAPRFEAEHQALRSGPFPAVYTSELLTRAGERRPVEWTVTPLRSASGQPSHLLGIGRDVTDQRRAEERLRESSEQLRALAGRLRTVREDEQTRVARDLHDELGQLLTGLKMDLRWMENRLEELPPGERVSALLDRTVAASELADQTVASVQRIAAELRPGALDRLGLVPALRQEARAFERRTGIACRLRVDDAAPESPPEVATALYRICQEALTNVSRHAGAGQVEVALVLGRGQLVLTVTDDGRGLEAVAAGPEALGLLGMTERASQLGGTVTFGRGPDGGTVVTARLPVAGGARA